MAASFTVLKLFPSMYEGLNKLQSENHYIIYDAIWLFTNEFMLVFCVINSLAQYATLRAASFNLFEPWCTDTFLKMLHMSELQIRIVIPLSLNMLM